MQSKYFYPKSLDDFEKGDKYQIKYPLQIGWKESDFVFSDQLCYSKKKNLKYLIKENRIRIIK